jgi:hypothetical protein
MNIVFTTFTFKQYSYEKLFITDSCVAFIIFLHT